MILECDGASKYVMTNKWMVMLLFAYHSSIIILVCLDGIYNIELDHHLWSPVAFYLFDNRGNAIMRPVAKNSTSKETEVAMNIESSADTGLPHRSGKSTTKTIIQKIMRTFRVVAVIAALNLPLYMMLIFKDWIDK